MSTARPEADIEYSRAHGASGVVSGESGSRGRGRPGRLRTAILGGGVLGAAVLLIAEFTPLLHVQSSAPIHVVKTVSTGAHHSYALVPIALLAAALAYAFWRTRSRQALIATGFLGLVTLLIALLGDLPDAQASGLIGSATTRYATATSTPAIGLYLETLGAVILLITAAAGLLLVPAPLRGDRQTGAAGPPRAPRRRSAS